LAGYSPDFHGNCGILLKWGAKSRQMAARQPGQLSLAAIC
jgi:hypothetical protein